MSIFAIMGIGSVEAAGKNDWAQFGRYAEANAALQSSPDVVFFGNSITDFWPGSRHDFGASIRDMWVEAFRARPHVRCLCAFVAMW